MRSTPPIVSARDLVRQYRGRQGRLTTALDGVSLDVQVGESVAVVGESGSGKSTLVRCLAGLERPDSGRVCWDGADLASLSSGAARRQRVRLQVIFQDALDSFDPRFTVEAIIREPLDNFPDQTRLWDGPRGAVAELLRRVRLDPALALRYPHQLSGGQQQRVAIARALALQPALLLCDEPLSGLDVMVQGQILALLRDLRRQERLALLFVTHNLAVVPEVAGRVLVVHHGRLVEELAADNLDGASHPYTRALLDAVPDLETPQVA